MKKFWMLTLLAAIIGTTTVQAQVGVDSVDQSFVINRLKERLKPQLKEKVKLTDEQADKVVELNYTSYLQRLQLRNLPADDQKKKMAELDDTLNKKLAAIPLTDAQVKGVHDFFEEMRRNMPQRNGSGREQ